MAGSQLVNTSTIVDGDTGAFLGMMGSDGKQYLINQPALQALVSTPWNPPRGTTWLADTISGFDIYRYGFAKTPTIFFDPSATGSAGTGSFLNPHTTSAELIARCAGDMTGQTLGIKRGTTFRHSGLTLTLNGSSGFPFTICPYGDATSLPIITTGIIITSWTLFDAPNGIWAYTVGATQHDVWQSNVRLTAQTWNTNAATTLTGAGKSTYNSNTLYIKTFDGSNPNGGQIEVSSAANSLLVNYSNVATTGNITICGLDLQKARVSTLAVANAVAGAGSITSCSGIVIVGNRVSGAGVDASGTAGPDGIIHYGPSDAVRSSSPYIAGNYAADVLNNAIEISGTTGAIIEYNNSDSVGGNSIVELWSSNSSAKVRYNRGGLASTFGRVYTGYAAGGIWFVNRFWNGSTWDAEDTTNAKNASNSAYFNLIVNPQKVMFQADGGTGHVMQHNTGYADHDTIFATNVSSNTNAPTGLYIVATATAAAGFLNFSNNLLYWKTTANSFNNPTYVNMAAGLGAANGVPIGDKNLYFNVKGSNTANWNAGGSITNFTTYKTAVSTYSLDQNSFASTVNTGGNLSAATLGFNESTYRPLAAAATGLSSLTGIGSMYQDGQPYVAASASPGALRGA